MTIYFYLKYHTVPGEDLFISGNNAFLGDNDMAKAVPLMWLNEDFWMAAIDLPDDFDDIILYRYILKDTSGIKIFDGEENRFMDLSRKSNRRSCSVVDVWNDAGDVSNVFFTAVFREILLPPLTKVKTAASRKATHELRVKAPVLAPGETVCMCGSTPNLGSWNTDDPILLKPVNNWYTCTLSLQENEWPAAYKYGIYDTIAKKFVAFEEGENRLIPSFDKKGGLIVIHDGFVHYRFVPWRGAGVSIPVFGLRSQKGFGVGEFLDIKLLVDWASQTGLRLIQLLPVNDTTAHHDWHDSYPYAAISAFALHPIYINLEAVAGKALSGIIKPLQKKKKQLNNLPAFDYTQVMKFKLSALRELYDALKDTLKNDPEYFGFFEMNREWLVPYAAFCYLRDKYKTADFTQWKKHARYNEAAVLRLTSSSQKHYDEIAFHYFVQYHLHQQMKEVVQYAHSRKVVLKGDVPIGVYRHGCDAWVNPSLYHMDQQAGAPPDNFAVKGQNWGFPTYNWEQMSRDQYSWWRRRFDQMSNYFDAFRIDHILGFFRIWSIPCEAEEGILGKFVPAIPVAVTEFEHNHIAFNHDRYCLPFITDDIVQEHFGERADEIKEKYLQPAERGMYHLKETVNTQAKVAALLPGPEHAEVRRGLFDLISNVILIEEPGSEGTQYHFRIAMDTTLSFAQLDHSVQTALYNLYIDYFYRRQNDFWRKEGMKRLPQLKRNTNMLVCGEDLGMVPPCVPEVMGRLGILSLEIERMPKKEGKEFFHPNDAPYLSVVTPSTHDMSTIRGWWEEDREATQRFYNFMLGQYGEAPFHCEPWISRRIVLQHLYAPAMWSIFQLSDLLGMSEKLRCADPAEERINVPANPAHYWHYRMHLHLEDLLKEKEFNDTLKKDIQESGRAPL